MRSFFKVNAGDSSSVGPWLIEDDNLNLSIRRSESDFDVSSCDNLLLD